MSEFGGGWTPEHSKRWINILAIYTVLFLVIGPKFEIYGVWSKIRDGEFVRNRIERFVAGSHQGDTVQLCFEGTLKGKETQMMYTANLSELEQPEQIVDGLGWVRFNEETFFLYSNDFKPSCASMRNPNMTSDKLPPRNTSVKWTLRDSNNQQIMQNLKTGAYVLFYRLNRSEKVYDGSFSVFINLENELTFYEYWVMGGSQRETDLGVLDYVKAALIDYVRWPYFWLIVLTGGASH